MLIVGVLALASFALACDKPQTTVILDNNYPASPTGALVVYRAHWQAVSFENITPGSSSDPQSSVSASENSAYVVLAPGWDPASSAPPTSFVVMQSRAGLDLHFDDTLHIRVDDTTFIGNCGARSFLPQAQADFITQRIFPNDFASLRYDAATCTTTLTGDSTVDAGLGAP